MPPRLIHVGRGTSVVSWRLGPRPPPSNERDLPGPVAPPQNDRQLPPVPGEIIEPFMEPQHESAASAREVPLETDVAPDLLDREAPTDEELH